MGIHSYIIAIAVAIIISFYFLFCENIIIFFLTDRQVYSTVITHQHTDVCERKPFLPTFFYEQAWVQ